MFFLLVAQIWLKDLSGGLDDFISLFFYEWSGMVIFYQLKYPAIAILI